MVEVQPDRVIEVPDSMVELLDKFANVMPTNLLDGFPLVRLVEHHIELVLGTKALAYAPYRMLPNELMVLKLYIRELLDSGKILPSKAPFRAPALF